MSEENKLKIPNKLSAMLLKERVSKNLSQTEMAEQVNLSYPVYAGIERGTYKASLMILTRISMYLGISVNEALELYQNKGE